MIERSNQVERHLLLREGWRENLAELVHSADQELVIASPYVTREGVRHVLSNLRPAVEENIRLSIVTNLSVPNICQGSTDPLALKMLEERGVRTSLFHLPRLHAKAYVADDKRAIVTSGNLTAGGLFFNYEYGVELHHRATVVRIRQDIDAYSQLGAVITSSRLDGFCKAAERARRAFRNKLSRATVSATQHFEEALRNAEDQLIRCRLAGGALHTVFANTILYLLKRHGPLATTSIHPLVETIHPDLCDNTVDRVIDGKRFGKKWKHAVRTAQQQLKKKRLIELVDGRWDLVRENVLG